MLGLAVTNKAAQAKHPARASHLARANRFVQAIDTASMLDVEGVLASGKSLFMAIFSSRGQSRGGMNRGPKRSDSVPAFYSEWYPASVLLFLKEGSPRLKTMKITAKLPIRTADFPTEPIRVRLRKDARSALGLTAFF